MDSEDYVLHMGDPKPKPAEQAIYAPHPDDRDMFDQIDADEFGTPVDTAAFLGWLETGEGDPFREPSA